MYHSRAKRKDYHKTIRNTKSCPFCDYAEPNQIVKSTKYSYIVPIKHKYDIWENHSVLDHLLVIPKRHVKSLTNLNNDEKLDAINLYSEYEKQGYNIYGRGKGAVRRTVEHQHTHLIKLDPKQPKMSVFINKPYFLLKI